MGEILQFPNQSNNINLFPQIFSALDELEGNEGQNGLELLANVLSLPDESFEAMSPILIESFQNTFNSTEAHIALTQMMNINGIKIEDLVRDFDIIIEAIENFEGFKEINLSQAKKDFIKVILGAFINAMQESNIIPKRVIQIPIELCNENAKLPTYATDGSAAMDVYSTGDYTINPGETILIPLGIKTTIPSGYALLIHPRSGLSAKTKIRIPNTVAIIDSDYRGEICVEIENISSHIIGSKTGENGEVIAPLYGSSFTISKGERFAQMRLVEVPMINWIEVDSIGTFDNNHGKGFGSTGKF